MGTIGFELLFVSSGAVMTPNASFVVGSMDRYPSVFYSSTIEPKACSIFEQSFLTKCLYTSHISLVIMFLRKAYKDLGMT